MLICEKKKEKNKRNQKQWKLKEFELIKGKRENVIKENISYIKQSNNNQQYNTRLIYDNIQDMDNFKEISNMKADQGAKPFIIDNHIIWLFKGLIPNNKADKVDLWIYDYSDSVELFNFIIHKKKYQFGMMMLCLKMN